MYFHLFVSIVRDCLMPVSLKLYMATKIQSLDLKNQIVASKESCGDFNLQRVRFDDFR